LKTYYFCLDRRPRRHPGCDRRASVEDRQVHVVERVQRIYPKFTNYTLHSAGWERILEEALNTEMILPPRKFPSPPNANQNNHCRYNAITTTSPKSVWRWKIRSRNSSKLDTCNGYVAKHEQRKPYLYSRTREQSPRERSPRERSPRNPRKGQERSKWLRERNARRQEALARVVMNTIFGGLRGGGTMYLARKRHLRWSKMSS